MIKVPFVDLTRQFQLMETDLTEIFKEVGRSGSYVSGEPVIQFEKEVAKFCGTKYALGVANATDGLSLAMKGLGIGPGDEVITPTNSFIASAGAIVAVGATPVLIDTCHCFNLDPDKLEKLINSKTKAVMPVHLTGRPAEMDKITKICSDYNIDIIEDAAQAIGAKYKGHRVGSLGTIGCFSLHPLKNLAVYGDGGFLTTNSTQLYERIKLLRNHGLSDRNTCEEWGVNSRLDTLQAAIALYKLPKLEELNLKFREIAKTYWEGLNNIVEAPTDKRGEYGVYHNYVIQVDEKDRDKLMEYLLFEHGVQTAIHYPKLIHTQPAAKNLGYRKSGDFPNAERLVKRMISLPIYPELSNTKIRLVINGINSYFNLK